MEKRVSEETRTVFEKYNWKSLESLFNPNSIAVIGASRDPNKLGGRIINNLVKYGYKGKIYPVNPHEEEIMSLKCYKSISDIPDSIDLACIATPHTVVPEIVKECAKKGVRNVIIISAGFAERSQEGEVIQNELVSIARRANMHICGPNTSGVVSLTRNVFASFTTAVDLAEPISGDIGFVAQSSATSAMLLSYAWHYGIGISQYVCAGNCADLEVPDYIGYLIHDEATRAIIVFLEGIRDGKKFVEVAEEAARAKKPIIVLKTGRTEHGKRAVKSHTGALAGSDEVYDAIFRQKGVIRVNDPEELLEVAMALAWQPLPKGNRAGIISISGGSCSLIVDECTLSGLEVPELTSTTLEKLRKILPPLATIGNPCDPTADILRSPVSFSKAIEAIAEDPNVDLLLVGIAGCNRLEFFEGIVSVSKRVNELNKPIFVIWTLGPLVEGVRLLHKNRLPVYLSPRKAITAIRAAIFYRNFQAKLATSMR